jgi:hypothetical protein
MSVSARRLHIAYVKVLSWRICSIGIIKSREPAPAWVPS